MEQKPSEQLLHAPERLASSIVDALRTHIAILDETGLIIAVNNACHFVQVNHPQPSVLCEGPNYFRVCDSVVGTDGDHAAKAGAGERAILRFE